jgi:hypothetical protein
MRLLTALLLVSFAGSLAVAADKDEEKVKEVVVAFQKALKEKDHDAMMKQTGLPFLVGDRSDKNPSTEKAEAVKEYLKKRIDGVKDAATVPTDVIEVVPAVGLLKKFTNKDNEEDIKYVEKFLGPKGFVVLIGRKDKVEGVVLVAPKDGKFQVVGLAH